MCINLHSQSKSIKQSIQSISQMAISASADIHQIGNLQKMLNECDIKGWWLYVQGWSADCRPLSVLTPFLVGIS